MKDQKIIYVEGGGAKELKKNTDIELALLGDDWRAVSTSMAYSPTVVGDFNFVVCVVLERNK